MDCAACDSISGNQQTGAVVACLLVIGVLLLVVYVPILLGWSG